MFRITQATDVTAEQFFQMTNELYQDFREEVVQRAGFNSNATSPTALQGTSFNTSMTPHFFAGLVAMGVRDQSWDDFIAPYENEAQRLIRRDSADVGNIGLLIIELEKHWERIYEYAPRVVKLAIQAQSAIKNPYLMELSTQEHLLLASRLADDRVTSKFLMTLPCHLKKEGDLGPVTYPPHL